VLVHGIKGWERRWVLFQPLSKRLSSYESILNTADVLVHGIKGGGGRRGALLQPLSTRLPNQLKLNHGLPSREAHPRCLDS